MDAGQRNKEGSEMTRRICCTKNILKSEQRLNLTEREHLLRSLSTKYGLLTPQIYCPWVIRQSGPQLNNFGIMSSTINR
jgi:hypothetical protein